LKQNKMNIWVNSMGNNLLWTITINNTKDYNLFKNKMTLSKETVQIDTNKNKNNNIEINK
jgi:hypothetical protein